MCSKAGSGWLPAWWPGRANVIQCDYIALISTQMVEEFFLESIIAEARSMRSAYFAELLRQLVGGIANRVRRLRPHPATRWHQPAA